VSFITQANAKANLCNIKARQALLISRRYPLGPIAQLVEHPAHNRMVAGSNPAGSTSSTTKEKEMEIVVTVASVVCMSLTIGSVIFWNGRKITE
jgi:hypothetical protein